MRFFAASPVLVLLLVSQPACSSRVDFASIDDMVAAARQRVQDIMAKYFDPSTTVNILHEGTQGERRVGESPVPAPSSPSSTVQQAKPASASTSSVPNPGSSNFQGNVLDKHNRLRVRHQASPLKWSVRLADGAQSWANGCVWGHADVEEGENLAIGYSSVEEAMQVWAEEEKRYQYGEVTPNMAYFEEIGHFTQMVWRATTEVGCATAQCPWQGRADATYLVCRYSPAGNVLGQFADNVKPPV